VQAVAEAEGRDRLRLPPHGLRLGHRRLLDCSVALRRRPPAAARAHCALVWHGSERERHHVVEAPGGRRAVQHQRREAAPGLVVDGRQRRAGLARQLR
jgi:hypothetical protein